ncbi:MAG TPA: hypothetical protein VEF53_18780 [Patescibacteria group bacterium]|nr:hypothetical protein [Patescibacteria group bacterium]
MINIKEGQKATVFSVEDKGTYIKAKLSTSRKDKQKDEWVNSSWFTRFVGKAKDMAKGLQDKDKITLVNAAIENVYDKDKKQSFLSLVVFKFECEGGSKPNETPSGFIPIDDDSDLPF